MDSETKAARKGKVTSSVAAACLGLDPYCTPLQAKVRILGLDGFEGNAATARGTRLEPVLIDYAAESHKLAIEQPGFVTHPKHDWIGDSVDALLVRDEPVFAVEAKTAGSAAAAGWGDEGTDEIPQAYLVQCHIHLIHHPVEKCVVPFLGGARLEFRLYYVARDEALHDQLINRLGEWHHKYIVQDETPPPQSGDDEAIVKLYPHARDGEIPSDPEIAKWAVHAAEIRARKKQLESEESAAKNQIRALLGTHSGCRGPWGSVTFRNNKGRAATDWQAVAREAGADDALIRRHTSIKPGPRVLRVNVKE